MPSILRTPQPSDSRDAVYRYLVERVRCQLLNRGEDPEGAWIWRLTMEELPGCEVADRGATVTASFGPDAAVMIIESVVFTPCNDDVWRRLLSSVEHCCWSTYDDGHLSLGQASERAVTMPAKMVDVASTITRDDVTLALLACGWRQEGNNFYRR